MKSFAVPASCVGQIEGRERSVSVGYEALLVALVLSSGGECLGWPERNWSDKKGWSFAEVRGGYREYKVYWVERGVFHCVFDGTC